MSKHYLFILSTKWSASYVRESHVKKFCVCVATMMDQLPLMVKAVVLDYLPTKDILNYRLVSSSCLQDVSNCSNQMAKRLCHRKMKFKQKSKFVQFINQVQSLPFTWFSLKFDGYSEMSCPFVLKFLMDYGPRVWRLHVHTMNAFFTSEERTYFNGFTSLKSLSVGKILQWGDPYRVPSLLPTLMHPAVPLIEPFRKLDELRFKTCHDPFLVHILLQETPNVNKLYHGEISSSFGYDGYDEIAPSQLQAHTLKTISLFLESRRHVNRFKLSFVKFPHLSNVPEDIVGKFIQQIVTKNVDVYGFSANICRHIQSSHVSNADSFWSSIVSMNGLNAQLTKVEMPKLQEINVRINNMNIDCFMGEISKQRQTVWPLLEKITLSITNLSLVNGIRASQSNRNHRKFVRRVLHFLCGSTRVSVKKLRLAINLVASASIIRMHRITTHLPNLTTVDLDIVDFGKEEYTTLFHNLRCSTRKLRLVVYCRISDNFFPGQQINGGHPLANIQHFEVDFRSQSSGTRNKITDDFVKNYLCKLSLKCLILQTSNSRLVQFTVNGYNQILTSTSLMSNLRCLELPKSTDPGIKFADKLIQEQIDKRRPSNAFNQKLSSCAFCGYD